MRSSCLIIFLGVTVVCSAHAQPDGTSGGSPERSSIFQTIVDDALIIPRATIHVFSFPARWESDDYFLAMGVIGATAGSSLLDDEVFDLMARNRNSLNDELTNLLTRYAEEPAAVILMGMYAGGLLSDNRWLRETAVLAVSALTVSMIVTQTGKFVVGRARPNRGLGNMAFDPFNTSSSFKSFPSGHTYVAFTLSAVLAERIGNPYATAGLYSLATFSAISRAYGEHHWFSDVLFTGLFSTMIARSVVKWFDGEANAPANGLIVVPKQNGITVSWVW